MQTFLELQYLVEYLVDNLELSKFSNTSLCVKNYLMGIDGIRNSDIKKHCKEQMLYRKGWPCVKKMAVYHIKRS